MLDRFADFVSRRRAAVLAAVLATTALLATQLPRLSADSAPEASFASHGYEDDVGEFRLHFGDTDSVVALLVVADDVTQARALGYVHAVSTHFLREPWVERVESVTVTPFPARRESEATLDELGDEPALDPRIEEALEVLIASEPERFPMGLLDVANRVGDGRMAPLGADSSAVRAALDDAPLATGRLVSADRRLASVAIFLSPELGTGERRIEIVHEIDAWLAAHPPPAGVEVHPAGIPHVRAAIRDAMLADQLFLVPISLLLCCALLYLSFRWTAGVVLPLAMVGLSVTCTLGAMALAGEPLSILMNTLPTLLIIMGVSEAVHVVGRYVEEAQRTEDRVEASRRAIRGLMIACFLTSFTTAVGFGSLIVAQTEMLRRFGVVAAIGVMISYAILITFVPAAITLFPRPPPVRAWKNRWLDASLVRVTSKIVRRPIPIVIATLLAMIPCAWAYAEVHVDTALLETFDEDDPVAVSTRLIERHLEGILPLEVHVEATDVRDPRVLAALDRVARWARAQDGALGASAPSDLAWDVWRRIAGADAGAPHHFRSRAQIDALITLLDRADPNPIRAWMSEDGRHARLEVRLADVGAQRSIALIREIEARTRRELASIDGVEITLIGEALINSHGVSAVVEDLFGSLGLSALVIFMTIALLFRSARIGAIAIPPNVIPQIGTVAWMVARGIPLNAGTAIVFSVAIGVSVDLTIHGLARLVDEERRGLKRRAALVRVAKSTGRAIVVACATLVLGFSVLLLSGFVPVRHFGELIAVALLLSLGTTLVLQPAMLTLLGGRKRPS